ncbi:hypothetical protein C8F04DRAFT_1233864 [Mycena alexandri]|uniref:Uncharacterized protein n=1 Tax=Mycena alexandri TaxID=1745969 RepID=A0AAD6SYL3_9AGAR|nr:hypothetical protein C8F04DRAFT_1233864 [Mycena alexandri]
MSGLARPWQSLRRFLLYQKGPIAVCAESKLLQIQNGPLTAAPFGKKSPPSLRRINGDHGNLKPPRPEPVSVTGTSIRGIALGYRILPEHQASIIALFSQLSYTHRKFCSWYVEQSQITGFWHGGPHQMMLGSLEAEDVDGLWTEVESS